MSQQFNICQNLQSIKRLACCTLPQISMHDEFSVELYILPEIVCLNLGELPLIPEEVVRHQKATDGEKCIYHESSI